jgi:hypothetical protein
LKIFGESYFAKAILGKLFSESYFRKAILGKLFWENRMENGSIKDK